MSSPRFYLPPPERDNPLWNVVSLVVHVIIVAVAVSVAGPTFLQEERITRITLLPLDVPGVRQTTMPTYRGIPSGIPGAGAGGIVGVVPSARIDSALPPPALRYVISDVAGLMGDTVGPPIPPGPRRLIGPAYGDGRVWVRAPEAELGVVGPSGDVATHAARVDSAVRARIQAFIDTMPRDSFALPPPTRWTTEIAGNTWGIDGTWIYLGDIKIPTALLALLPFPQGNYEQAQAAAQLQGMREDIIQAARRAETAKEFRSYVNELRRRRDEERERLKARRDTIVP